MAEKDCTASSSNDCTVVGSTAQVSSSNAVPEMISSSCLSSNPFAIKNATCASSLTCTTDEKSRPLIAPSTLKLDNSDAISESPPASSSVLPKVVLRPSRLAAHTEKLEFINSGEKDSVKGEGTEYENNFKNSDSSAYDSKGNMLKSHLFSAGISSAVSKVSPTKSSGIVESSFCINSEDNSHVSGGFVFGQNLHERALNYHDSDSHTALSQAKTDDLTFEDAALKKDELDKAAQEQQLAEFKKSLSESAKEYESKQSKRKFDEISVITGEEEESNVLQINCKLFAFDKAKMNWHERGRGILRLNDRICNGVMQSRVVMRTHGNLRVVLNTKVWAGMVVEHPSEKTVRLTAIDSEGIAVYLVMARPKDADQLFSALDWRVGTLKSGDGNASGKDDTVHESASSSSVLLPQSSNDSFNSSPPKRCRMREGNDSSVESGAEFVPSESKTPSDSANLS